MMRAKDPGERGADQVGGPGDPGRLDPTRMANQPALRTSSGLIWILMGGFFAVASLIPLGLLIFAGSGRSRGLASVVAVTVVVLYALLIVFRFALPRGPVRLRSMAVCLLAMAAAALVGVWVCAIIESAPAP